MKLAILSDIHGNAYALETVLKDIDRRNVYQIFNIGDILYGPLDPMGTFELLKNKPILSISGNQDRVIVEHLEKASKLPTLNFVLSQLSAEAKEFLVSLPFDIHYKEAIYLCHATPQKDDEYLLESLHTSYVGVKSNNEIDTILKDIDEKMVVCGHSHLPRMLKTVNKTVINPGSVGLPAYDDDLPIVHKMETFSPDAKYCILNIHETEVTVEQISVPYNFEISAKLAEKNNRPDWAKWIRTGRA